MLKLFDKKSLHDKTNLILMTITKIRWYEIIRRPEDRRQATSRLKELLRYDTGFHNDDELRILGIVAFPVFKTTNGPFGGTFTEAYWKAAGFELRLINSVAAGKFKDLINTLKTYRFPRDKKGKILLNEPVVPVLITDFLNAKESLGVFE